MGDRAVGIDLGASAIWAVAAERDAAGGWTIVAGDVFAAGELDRAVQWCGGAVVAIDAPARRSEGLHSTDERLAAKFRRARCAAVALRLEGHAVAWISPADGEEVAGWMQVGFDLWRAFAAVGAPAPLEVFPHAIFAALLGRRPANKLTVDGRRTRLEVLHQYLGLPSTAELWGHDAIDAAAAALVAAQRLDGVAREVRCGEHGGPGMWQPAAT